MLLCINKGANLVGALASTDFLVLKSQTYYNFLTSRSQSLGSLEKSRSAPTLLRPDWHPCV